MHVIFVECKGNDMKLSVIVTVYNCDKYIGRCLNSLDNQTYGEFEIVIVDDGSHDMSAELCDRFAETRDDVQVIHKANGGTVSARKAGLLAAKGDVVCFIDGDDWIDKEFCEKLLIPFLNSEKIDVVSSGLKFEYISEPQKNHFLFDGAEAGVWESDKRDSYLLPNLYYEFEKETSAITSSICCKMIKRNTALSAMADMDEQLTLGEDGAYVFAVLAKAKDVYVLNEAYYHYEQHEGSQNYKFDFDAYKQLKRLQQCMEAIAMKMGKSLLMKSQIEYYIKGYLRSIEKSIFKLDEDGMVYILPDDLIEFGSKVVIHGAGKVGNHYVKCVKRTKKYELAGWTDKNGGRGFKNVDIPCSLSELPKLSFDYVVLAANDSAVLAQMVEDVSKYNIPKEKIVSQKPLSYRV